MSDGAPPVETFVGHPVLVVVAAEVVVGEEVGERVPPDELEPLKLAGGRERFFKRSNSP